MGAGRWRWGAIALAVAAVVFIAGFLIFAQKVAGYRPSQEPADGIVVLTGGEQRLNEGLRLLAGGRGRRLLISGVNKHTTRADIKRTTTSDPTLFECCVDIGYEALDTMGNADETRTWVDTWHFRRLLIVTSSYHMPRSLIELGRAIPNVTLVAYPIQSRNFHPDTWWRHLPSARILLSEYIKLLRSVTHYGLSRLWPWGRSIPLAHGERAAGK